MRTLRTPDDRATSIDTGGDRLAYLVLSFGLLAVVAYRSFVRSEVSWDLLGLVVLGGIVSVGDRLSRGTTTRESALRIGLTMLIALAVAFAVVLTVGT